ITGASSGIGQAMAIDFAARGAKVVLAARSTDKLEKLADLIRKKDGTALPVTTDVSDEKQCQSLINLCVKTFGRIDVLVNNAGISMRANFNQVDLSVLKRLMDTNFWGSVYCTRYALPYLLEQRGSLVGVSSICGITPLPGRTGYTASKHALDGFLETIRLENYENGLHVMLVHPGFTSSNIRNLALNKYGLPQVDTPLDEERLMPAEEVAREVATGIVEKRRDVTLTTEGKFITWLYRHVPAVADKVIFREMKKETGAPF
ncbi:MAG TPA: SDR family oxidoreductase, partial [Bacteroidales bacterium]|nr:SDR family oxidoreductase [Bacteroidales bacterium]